MTPSTLKAVTADQLSFPEMFRLALKSLALKKKAKPGESVWLSEEPKDLHARLLALQSKLQASLTPLASLHFMTKGPFPYSTEVTEALDLLQQANVIAR